MVIKQFHYYYHFCYLMTYFTIIIIIIELNMHREIIKYSDRLFQTHRFEKRVKCLIIKIIIQLFD